MPPGLPKLHPFRVYASRTSSHELQHPLSGGSPPKHEPQYSGACFLSILSMSLLSSAIGAPGTAVPAAERRVLVTSCEMSRWSSPDMSIKSRDMTGQNRSSVCILWRGQRELGWARRERCLTIAWYSWERHIEMHGQLFSPAPVDNYRGVDADSPIVEKFHDCKRQYDCGRDQRHCETKVQRVSHGISDRSRSR